MAAPDELLGAVRTSTAALVTALQDGSWSDADVRAPSLLPGWSRGHVLTHIARNADGIAVTLVPDDGGGLDRRVAAGNIPDVAIVARPFDAASLGLAGLLVDQSGFAAAKNSRGIAVTTPVPASNRVLPTLT